MDLHLNKELFREFIDNLNTRTGIDSDIIEKDYYVCTILKELSKNQDELQVYFKGGTAVYKILDTMNRFSEDIDLTVKVLPEQSNTKNKNRLKQSALGYEIEGLELSKDSRLCKVNQIKEMNVSFIWLSDKFKISKHKEHYSFFILGLEIKEAIYPKNTAAAIPPAEAETPPVKAPTIPDSLTPLIAPLAKL